MTRLYQILMALTSVVVLACFVKMYVLMFIVMSFFIALSSKFIGKGRSKGWVFVNVVIIIAIFFSLKSSSDFILPLGYSVFAFSAISLIVTQRRNYNDYTVLEIFCYLLFFPKIFAAPIDRADDFIRQIRGNKKPTIDKLYLPIKMCIFACFYKFVIADRLYVLCDKDYYGLNEVCSILCYGVAFFFDFYAYSIFAISFGKLLGIELPENFDSPYRSHTFRDFWKKWNITLGTWLKDYVYIPLGGNRVSTKQCNLNIILVFIVSAIWHDASLPFFVWGITHALLLIIERYLNIKGNRCYGLMVFIVCILMWQMFDINRIEEFVLRLAKIAEYQPIETPIVIGSIISLFALWFADRNSTKDTIFLHKKSPRYILKEVPLTCTILILDMLLANNPSINFFYMRF